MPGGLVTLTVDGSPMQTYVAVPDGDGPFPAVVVAQHQSGVDAFIRSACDRLAEAGYAAAAPDQYHRQTDMTFEELAAIPRGRWQQRGGRRFSVAPGVGPEDQRGLEDRDPRTRVFDADRMG